MTDRSAEAVAAIEQEAARRPRSRNVRPLRQLLPYLKPYPWVILGALVGLALSSSATLVFPLTVPSTMKCTVEPFETASNSILMAPVC